MDVININRTIGIKLTEYGAEILNKYYEDSIPKGFILLSNKHSAGDIEKFSLWEMAHIFGKSMYNGNPKIPFVDNEIYIYNEGV